MVGSSVCSEGLEVFLQTESLNEIYSSSALFEITAFGGYDMRKCSTVLSPAYGSPPVGLAPMY